MSSCRATNANAIVGWCVRPYAASGDAWNSKWNANTYDCDRCATDATLSEAAAALAARVMGGGG